MRKRLLLLLLVFILVFSLPTTLQAADTPRLGLPSGYSFLGGGFSNEPETEITILSDQTKELSAKADFAFIYATSLKATRYTWYRYLSANNSWLPVKIDDQQDFPGTTKYTFGPMPPGTYYLQLEAEMFGKLLGIRWSDYFSRVIVIHVIAKPLPATKVSVSLPRESLLPGMTTQAEAHLEPAGSTSQITWSIKPADLATIDPNTGAITTYPDKTGVATVTATANGLSDSKLLDIGGLSNQTVNPGQTATFSVSARPIGQYTYQWYEIGPNGAQKLIPGVTGPTLQIKTSSNPDLTTNPDNNRRFRAQIIFSNTEETLLTRIATLHLVNPATGPVPWLQSAPNFSASVSLETVQTLDSRANATPNSGISVIDIGSGPGNWYLTATIGHLMLGSQRLDAVLTLNLASPITLQPDVQTQIATQKRGTSWDVPREALSAFFRIKKSPEARLGQYQGSITWTLNLVPPT
ncbi:Ig-like domain-containing protein [Lacticaseibacillus brantae]|nr:Ig-like domain-containing protein [Lacticaseibacillus brantae]